MSTIEESLERQEKLQGVGCSRKRKEDPRFIQGKGQYVDDVKLPGMLCGVAVRSPFAHAKIVSINKNDYSWCQGNIKNLEKADKWRFSKNLARQKETIKV